jgi:thioredoxin 1
MAVTAITKDNLETEVVNEKKPVLIDLWADWCGPCMKLSPLIEEISNEVEDVKFCKINVDDEPELAAFFQASSIPMLVFIKDGKIADAIIGVRPKKDIMRFINENK